MPTNDEWIELVDINVPWQKRYSAISAVIRPILATLSKQVGAKELMDNYLRPPSEGPTKARLYHALEVLAKHALADCVTLLPPSPMYGDRGPMVRRKLWHAPNAVSPTGAGGVTRPCSNPVAQIPGLGASAGKCWRTMSLWETRLMLSDPHHPFHVRHHVNFRAMMGVIHEIEEGKPAPWLEPDDDDLSDLTGE